MKRRPDISDLLFLGGLALVGAGLWMISPAVALIVIGGVLMAVGLAGAIGKGRSG